MKNGQNIDFPATLTAEMLKGFVTTECGCTHPRAGSIGGKKYIAKCGSWSRFSSEGHVRNELVADEFLRQTGLNVPQSRGYYVDFGDGRGKQLVRLAEFVETEPLWEAYKRGDAQLRAKIRRQAIAAYPAQAFVAGIDTFTVDNVRVDDRGELWFVDNGASFDYRACGKMKGWFWTREDPADALTGYLALAKHPDQHVLQMILGKGAKTDLLAAAKGVRFVDWTENLPEGWRRPELAEYARKLDEFCASK